MSVCAWPRAKGTAYQDLRPLIAIHLLGEPLLPEETHGGAYHSIFELRHHQTSQRLTDLLSVHIIELPRLPTAACSTAEQKWLHWLLRGHTMKPHEIAALNLQAIEHAEERLRDISTDWDLRMTLIQREKVERDILSNYIEGTRAAKKEGKRESLLQLLELRGVAVSTELRARIDACEDLDRLNAWFAQAVHCQSADELR